MSPLELTLVAISLALDATVVAISAGALNTIRLRMALLIAFTFGLFQAAMPLLGYTGGIWFREYLLAYGHVIGFVLILLVGLNMLKEALGPESLEEEKNILHLKTLLVLAVATSIDAFVVGITFNFIPVSIPLALLLIGIVTFALSLAGVYLGKSSKHFIGAKIEIIGAVILILLAFKTLFS